MPDSERQPAARDQQPTARPSHHAAPTSSPHSLTLLQQSAGSGRVGGRPWCRTAGRREGCSGGVGRADGRAGRGGRRGGDELDGEAPALVGGGRGEAGGLGHTPTITHTQGTRGERGCERGEARQRERGGSSLRGAPTSQAGVLWCATEHVATASRRNRLPPYPPYENAESVWSDSNLAPAHWNRLNQRLTTPSHGITTMDGDVEFSTEPSVFHVRIKGIYTYSGMQQHAEVALESCKSARPFGRYGPTLHSGFCGNRASQPRADAAHRIYPTTRRENAMIC